MSVSETSRIIIDESRMMLQIVTFLTDDFRGGYYNCNMFIVKVISSSIFIIFALQKGNYEYRTLSISVIGIASYRTDCSISLPR
jgi:hypothetical protein